MQDRIKELEDRTIVKALNPGVSYAKFEYLMWGSKGGSTIEAASEVFFKPPKGILVDRKWINEKKGSPLWFDEYDLDFLKEHNLEHTYGIPRIRIDGWLMRGPAPAENASKQEKAAYVQRCVETDKYIVQQIREFEKKHGNIHMNVLGGYFAWVHDPILDEFPDQLIGTHPANTSILDEIDGRMYRRFTGGDAVKDAILAGQTKTRSSVIIIDSTELGEDHGETLVMGRGVPRQPGFREEFLTNPTLMRTFIDEEQQYQQKIDSDQPALDTTLRLIALDRLWISVLKVHYKEWRQVYLKNEADVYAPLGIEGVQLPYQGLDKIMQGME